MVFGVLRLGLVVWVVGVGVGVEGLGFGTYQVSALGRFRTLQGVGFRDFNRCRVEGGL